MTPFVLILVFKLGYGATAIAVDFPNKESCYMAKEEAKQVSQAALAWCLDRRAERGQ